MPKIKMSPLQKITCTLLSIFISIPLLFGASKHKSPHKTEFEKLEEKVQSLHAKHLETKRKIILLKQKQASNVPPGTVIAYAGPLRWQRVNRKIVPTPPTGWLYCDGSYHDAAKYPALYKALLTPGKTTAHYGEVIDTVTRKKRFRVPQMKGVFLRGVTYGDGGDKNFLSRKGPFERNISTMYRMYPVGTEQAQATKLPSKSFKTGKKSHTHNHNHGVANRAWRCYTGNSTTTRCDRLPSAKKNSMFVRYPGTNIGITGASVEYTITRGGDEETRPRNTYVHYLIKY